MSRYRAASCGAELIGIRERVPEQALEKGFERDNLLDAILRAVGRGEDRGGLPGLGVLKTSEADRVVTASRLVVLGSLEVGDEILKVSAAHEQLDRSPTTEVLRFVRGRRTTRRSIGH